jgi:hypothetical protein
MFTFCRVTLDQAGTGKRGDKNIVVWSKWNHGILGWLVCGRAMSFLSTFFFFFDSGFFILVLLLCVYVRRNLPT